MLLIHCLSSAFRCCWSYFYFFVTVFISQLRLKWAFHKYVRMWFSIYLSSSRDLLDSKKILVSNAAGEILLVEFLNPPDYEQKILNWYCVRVGNRQLLRLGYLKHSNNQIINFRTWIFTLTGQTTKRNKSKYANKF